MSKTTTISFPVLDVKYAKRRVEHLSMMLTTINDTGGTIQPGDMSCIEDTLHDLKDQLEAYETKINQLEEDIKESIS